MTARSEPAATVDAFHRGDFWLVQPKGAGHRAGMDAMMLAAAVPSGFAGRLADFGAGAGAAGLAVASRCPDASGRAGRERAGNARALPNRRIAHPDNAHLGDRVSLHCRRCHADRQGARGGRARRRRASTSSIMNPPFNAGHDRATPDALKRDAHVMPDGLFERWIRSAAADRQAARRAGGDRPAAIAGADPRRTRRPLRQGRDRAGAAAPRRAGDPHRGARRCGPRAAGLSLLPALSCTRPAATASRRAPTPSTTAAPRFSAIDGLRHRGAARHCADAANAYITRNQSGDARLETPSQQDCCRNPCGRTRVTIPVIRLHGTIMSGGGQFRPSLSLASTAGLIEKAFAYNDAPAVAISINSPGGSPVQSRLIYQRIRDLAAEKNKTVLVFVEDVAASGGYMIAVAGDEIIADPVLDRRLDRRGVGLVRPQRGDQEARRRAPRLHGRPQQGVARSVPAGKARGRRAAEGAAARSARDLHRHRQGAARRPS